jgi:hypothetical protein
MSLRRLNFDVEALGDIAAKASGPSERDEIEVIGEGIRTPRDHNLQSTIRTFNRVFRLGLNNGQNVVARILFVMQDREISLRVARWQQLTLFGPGLAPPYGKCLPGMRPQIIT